MMVATYFRKAHHPENPLRLLFENANCCVFSRAAERVNEVWPKPIIITIITLTGQQVAAPQHLIQLILGEIQA